MSRSLLALLLLGLVLVAQATKLDLAQGTKASGSGSDDSDDSESGSDDSDDSESGSDDSDSGSDDSGSGSGGSGSGSDESGSGGSDDEDDGSVKLGKGGVTIKKGHHAGHTIVIQNKNTVHSVSKGGGDMAAMMAMNQANERRHEESEKKRDQERKEREAKEEARKTEKKKEEESRKEQEEKKKKDQLEAQKQKAKEQEKKNEMKEKKAKVAAQERENKARERHQKKLNEAKAKHGERNGKAQAKARERRAKQQAQERRRKHQGQERRRKGQERSRKAQERRVKARNFRFARGWRNYGHSYEPARCFRWSVYAWVHGLVRGHHGFVGYLPGYCRPRFGRLIFSVIKGGHPARVDVLRDGRVYHIAGGGGGWMSLSGIHFSVVHDHGLRLVWGWRPYGYGYRRTGVRNVHNLCMVTGLIRSGRWGYFGRLPGWCYPNRRLIFSLNNHARITRVDVLRNGYFLRVGGYAHHGWISLDGLAFYRGRGHVLRLYSGWRHYGHYRLASAARIGHVCMVSGLIKNGHWRNPITVLPGWCRPRQRLIFGGNVHMSSARIDVVPSGHVYYINGKQRWHWLALDGVKFYTR